MTSATPQRFVFLDVLRALAVLWMIQVHITNVILAPSLKTDWIYNLLNISNGFVAPAFIFCAGIGLYIALTRKAEDYLQFKQPLRDYLRRLSFILFWAYMLHIPVFAFSKFPTLTLLELQSWLQFDVLQTIVFASLTVLLVFFIARDVHNTALISGVTACGVFFGTVFMWQHINASHLPVWITYALSNNSPSGFPYLPWSGYLMAGVFFSDMFFRASNKQLLARYLVGVGLVLPVLIFMWKGAQVHTPWSDLWWSSSPGMHAFRICGLLVGFGGLFLIENFLRSSKVGTTLQILGMESLFLYLSHLQIVYGEFTPRLFAWLGIHDGNYATVAVAWLVITIPLVYAAIVWHRFKKTKPVAARWILTAQIVCTLLLFMIL